MNDIREDLKAYVDGELSETRAAEVAAAIAADPELAQEAEFMRVLGLEIKRAAAEPEVSGRALAIERARNAKPKWSPFTWRFAMQAAVSCALVAVVGALIFPIFAQSKSAASYTYGSETAPATAKVDAPAEEAADMARSPADAGFSQGGGGGAGAWKNKAQAPANERRDRGLVESKSAPVPEREAKTSVPMKGSAASRLVVKNGDLSVRVDSAAKAMQSAGTIAESMGGFVVSSNSNDLKGMQPSGTVVLRVPATRFDAAMQKLRALGDVTGESSSGEDVTAQVADIGARLKVLRAEEDSYITMLRAARKVSEMLEIKERLSIVRQEIESLTAQITSLKDLATMSTITASFEQKVSRTTPEEQPKGGFEETWNGAVNGLQNALTFLGQAIIVIFVYSPIWLPILLVGWWVKRRMDRPS